MASQIDKWAREYCEQKEIEKTKGKIEYDWINAIKYIGKTQYKLKHDAYEDHVDFVMYFEKSGCGCHLSPPCSFCTHRGNPSNLENVDDVWVEDNGDEDII